MAIVNSLNNAKISAIPSKKIEKGEFGGKVRSLFDSYVFPGAVFAANDEINLITLPKGARVVDAKIVSPSLGATGIFTLGHRANLEDAEDDNALVISADAGGQAVSASMAAASVANLKKFESETQLYLKCSEATAAANGLEIKVFVEYVLD